MHIRTRKLIGVIASFGFMTIYCLIAMVIGAVYFVEINRWLQAAYFIAAGLLWLPGLMMIIRWMSVQPAPGNSQS